jgi:hypothetical protein
MKKLRLWFLSISAVLFAITNMVMAQPKEIDFTVYYSRTLEQMIYVGHYDSIDVREEYFPVPTELAGKKISVSAKLFHFDREISNEETVLEINNAGYRPANIFELLALGSTDPGLQRQFPVVAIASTWGLGDGGHYVPCLDVSDSARLLRMFWLDRDWPSNIRFLAVKKHPLQCK